MKPGIDPAQLAKLIPADPTEPENSKDVHKAEKQNDTLEQQAKRLKNERYSQDTGHRSNLSWWAAMIVTLWLTGVFILLFMNETSVYLSDSVLITLLGTTTVNVLGLMYIVLRDLFNGTPE